MFQEILLFVFGFTLVVSIPEPFYRKDYTYVDHLDAFYKVHWNVNGLSWTAAFLACGDEESSMFYPKMQDEWTVVKTLVSTMKVQPNLTEIFVGMHYEVDLGEFITVDGDGLVNQSPVFNDPMPEDNSSLCVTMDINDGTYKLQRCNNVKLFMCKKNYELAYCPTVDTGYTYMKGTGRCLKFHEATKTWKKAMETCFMEGGFLAMIVTSTETEVIIDYMNLYNTDYFVGFRRIEPHGDFYTVKGRKFDDTFFKKWYHGETSDTQHDCGVIFKVSGNVYTMTKNCEEPAPFVCEMPSKSYTWSVLKSQEQHASDDTKAITSERTIDFNVDAY